MLCRPIRHIFPQNPFADETKLLHRNLWIDSTFLNLLQPLVFVLRQRIFFHSAAQFFIFFFPVRHGIGILAAKPERDLRLVGCAAIFAGRRKKHHHERAVLRLGEVGVRLELVRELAVHFAVHFFVLVFFGEVLLLVGAHTESARAFEFLKFVFCLVGIDDRLVLADRRQREYDLTDLPLFVEVPDVFLFVRLNADVFHAVLLAFVAGLHRDTLRIELHRNVALDRLLFALDRDVYLEVFLFHLRKNVMLRLGLRVVFDRHFIYRLTVGELEFHAVIAGIDCGDVRKLRRDGSVDDHKLLGIRESVARDSVDIGDARIQPVIPRYFGFLDKFK